LIVMSDASTHDPQLLKGLLSFVLLQLLAEEESYGYDVVSRLQQAGIEVLEGTVYPALARLEREGRLSSRLVASHSGPARKYYRPTPEGYAELERGARSWRALTKTVGTVLDRPVPDHPKEGL
jgi:PadR family transcriptional regulator PadR